MVDASVRGMTVKVSQELVTETCCECGMLFAMTADFKRQKLEARGTRDKGFYCPAGHSQYYTGEREADKLRRELERAKQNAAYLEDRRREAREEAEHQRRRANGYKGHAARITKRAKAGVCPCCNRHFVALERHMASKHPEFTPDCPEPLRVIEGGKVA